MDCRAPGLARKSLKDVAERLRGFLQHLHRSKLHRQDFSSHVNAPLLYAYEGIPSILTTEQIDAVLGAAAQDTSSWFCHACVPVSQLIYAAFRSNAKGLLPPSDEWRRRGL